MRQSIHDFIDTFYYVAYLAIYEDLKDYIHSYRVLPVSNSSTVHILANGPSLKATMEDIQNNLDKYADDDFCAVNYLSDSDLFSLVKPKYYVLSDPQFFTDKHKNSHKAALMLEGMNKKVTWDMNLYVPILYFKQFVLKMTNPNIVVVPMHTRQYIGSERLRFWFYKHGLGDGEFGTVVQNAIYTMINLHYKYIKLYGVDHNFFDNLVLNDKNQVCSLQTHFYDKEGEKQVPVPIMLGLGEPPMVHEFLEYYGYLFRGHKILNDYARYMGCEIINCTPNSLIDSYRK